MAIAFGSAGSAGESLTTTVDIPYPSGISAGDLLILHLHSREAPINWTTPTNWTLGDYRQQNTVTEAAWYWKIATGSESGSLTVSRAAASTILQFGRMYRYSGTQATGTPVEAAAQNGLGANATVTPTDITTTDTNRRVMVLTSLSVVDTFGSYTGGTATVPEDTAEVSTATGTAATLAINGLNRTAAETFDFGAQTISGSVSWIAFSFAILPLVSTPQQVRPDADTTTTGWTTTPLFSKINDSSDGTVITGALT